jgi:hypothetical protein
MAPGRYWQHETLANEWEVWSVGPVSPINRVVKWLACLGPALGQGAGPVHCLDPAHLLFEHMININILYIYIYR